MPGSPIVDALLSELDEVARRRLADMLAPYLEHDAPTSPLLTADEAAAYLRCDRRRVWDLVRTKAVPARRDGRRVLLHRDDLDAYLTTRDHT
ncbi:MAG: hypothetical protein JWM31_746 [Solirubrobacterales bacterium]|nr:hypothetical protein [Solirubrobacterales bacterium]